MRDDYGRPGGTQHHLTARADCHAPWDGTVPRHTRRAVARISFGTRCETRLETARVTRTHGAAYQHQLVASGPRVDAGVKELNEMTIGRTDDPENPFGAPAFEAARVFGFGSRIPSGPAVMMPRREGRTHDRNRPARQNSHLSSCIRGAVHTCTNAPKGDILALRRQTSKSC